MHHGFISINFFTTVRYCIHFFNFSTIYIIASLLNINVVPFTPDLCPDQDIGYSVILSNNLFGILDVELPWNCVCCKLLDCIVICMGMSDVFIS